VVEPARRLDGEGAEHLDLQPRSSVHHRVPRPYEEKRFYIDVAHRVRIEGEALEFVDLFLDVMIDPTGAVSEKDEHQLIFLGPQERQFARAARDEVRQLIAAADPLFDPRGPFYDVPDDAKALPPSTQTTDLL
jgi:hypothetical protein